MSSTRETLWTVAVAAVALFGSYGFACVFPFVAVAGVAALTLPLGRALGLTLAVWAANQVVGYAFMHYPHTLDTALLGGVLGVGALAATVIVNTVAEDRPLFSPTALGGLGLAFTVFEAIQYLGALALGGLDGFAPRIVAGIGLNDLGWFLMLAGLRTLLAGGASATRGTAAPATR